MGSEYDMYTFIYNFDPSSENYKVWMSDNQNLLFLKKDVSDIKTIMRTACVK